MPSTSFSGWIAVCIALIEMCFGTGRCRMMPLTCGSAFSAAMAARSSSCVIRSGRRRVSKAMPTPSAVRRWLRT